MAIISDSSPLIIMVKIGRLGLMRRLYRRVLIPSSVYQEVVIEGRRLRKAGIGDIEEAIQSEWINVTALTKSQLASAEKYRTIGGIGRGEAEALALARNRRLPVILDDRHARELARTLGLRVTGTAAMLLEAYFRKAISKKEFTESLRDLGTVMWLSPDVVAEILRLAEEVE